MVGPLTLVQAFRSIRSNRHPILGLETLEYMTSPLDRRRGSVRGGARPASLEEAGGLGFCPFQPNFGICSPEITTHLKLVEIIRIK